MKVIDSHTEGEPTRIIVEGGPDLGGGSMADRAKRFREKFDHIRSAVCNEPRGHDAVVGGLLCESGRDDCECGVIFFNNAQTIGMCVHGTIGLMKTLAYMGRIGAGNYGIETPVGMVQALLDEDDRVTVTNVPSYLWAADRTLVVPPFGEVRGDVAWAGNWFYLIENSGLAVTRENISQLSDYCRRVRVAMDLQGFTAENGAQIDHVEIFGPPGDPSAADSRNFVYCPGGAYDRSPCGTGTSGKLACLAAKGKLGPGEIWRQAGILDTVFECSYQPLDNGRILPRVLGRAWVTGESNYHFDESDPFQYGIPSSPHNSRES